MLEELTAVVANVRPDLILTLGPNDTHQEHRQMYELTLGAARRCRATILSYAIVSNTNEFHPKLFVDVSEFIDDKIRALRKHESQQDRPYMSDEFLKIFHTNRYAAQSGVRHCEAYEVVRLFS